MAYANNIVTKPVSIYDIQRAVSNSAADLGTLIANGAINMWAKFKPVRKALINTYDQLNAAGTAWKADSEFTSQNPPWWAGTAGQYGLDVANARANTTASSSLSSGTQAALNTIATKIDGNLNGWAYLRPSGGTSQPFRMLDFLRHMTNAPKPVSGVTGSPKVVGSDGNNKNKWKYEMSLREVNAGAISSRDFIIPSDIITYSSQLITGMIVGLVIYRKVGTTYTAIAWTTGEEWVGYGVQQSTTGNDIDYGDSYCTAHFKGGITYYALPVYFSESCAQPSFGTSKNLAQNRSILTIPYTNFIEVEAVYRSTLGTVALVTLGNRIIVANDAVTSGTFDFIVNLDATDSAYSGGTFGQIVVGIVNEIWNANPSWDSPPAGSTKYWQIFTDYDHCHVNNNSIKNVVSFTEANAISFTGADLRDHTWMVVVATTNPNDEYYFPLIQPAQPYAPV